MPAAQTDARLALASEVLIIRQFENTPYEVTLPGVPWVQEQSYINAQSIQPVKFTEFIRKATGKFDPRVMGDGEAVLKRWLIGKTSLPLEAVRLSIKPVHGPARAR